MEGKVISLLKEAREVIRVEWLSTRWGKSKEDKEYADYLSNQMRVIDKARLEFDQNQEAE